MFGLSCIYWFQADLIILTTDAVNEMANCMRENGLARQVTSLNTCLLGATQRLP